ncbi:glyoxalase [Apiospora kogelbergensis]|uniref:glyoxalase n=1 Tax=Apiospora kogelbergensis TaxID=1337665 RepID=UPI003131B8EB
MLFTHIALPAPWLAAAFVLVPGGKHSDGVTENALVYFADGSYLELLAFADDERGRAGRPGHRWGAQTEGAVIDWALTLRAPPAPDNPDQQEDENEDVPESARAGFRAIQQGVRDTSRGALEYRDLLPGGRHRPDGAVLRWATSAAARKTATGQLQPVEPGVLPFWCLDATPRGRRVPRWGHGKRTGWEHASGAVGVAVLQVTPPSALETPTGRGGGDESDLRKVYDVLFDGKMDEEGGRWAVEVFEARHEPGEVRLGERGRDGDGTEKLSLALFTTSREFAGRTVGGPVTDKVRLEFEFVFASCGYGIWSD